MTQELFQFVQPVKPDWKPDTPPELKKGEAVGFDFEYEPGTNPTKDKPFSLSVWSPGRGRGWYLPWGHEYGGNLDKEVVVRWIKEQMHGRPFYSVNAKAEVHQIHNLGIDPDKMDLQPRDVVFNAALLDENRFSGYGMVDLAEEYKVGLKKIQLTVRPDRMRWTHAGEIADYCINDSHIHSELNAKTYPMIVEEGLEEVLALENACIIPTVECERNGAILDRAKLEVWEYQIDEKINALFMETHREIGLGIDPNKSDQMHRLFKLLDLPVPSAWNDFENRYVEGFSEEALATVKHPTVQRVLKLRKWMSLKSKYISKYLRAIDGNNVLRFSLHQLRSDSTGDDRGTVVGRYSCGGDPPGAPKRNINIQQVPKAEDQIEDMGEEHVIRELFIAQSGQRVGASDASQLQFRLFSHYAKLLGFPGTADAYAKDPWIDFHMMVTKIMRPLMVCPNNYEDDWTCPVCKGLKAERKHQKHNNFGKLFGMGRPKIARRLGLPCTCDLNWYERDDNNKMVRYFKDEQYHEDACKAIEANAIVNEYDSKFPEAKALMEAGSKRAKTVGFVRTLSGRKRRFPNGQKLHKALNAFIIGSEGDVFKKKLVALYRERKRLGLTLRMLVHDEFVYDQPEEERLVKSLDELLEVQDYDLQVKLLWETGYGNNWKEANLA